MRLNQFLAKHLGLSRRKADEVIEAKRVRVNGHFGEFSNQIEEADEVEVLEGRNWKNISQNKVSSSVLLVYKPPKIMTTRDDPEKRKTIYDILPNKFESFKSAGRLDFLSEGLLVLSQNGHLIFTLTHPKFKTKKTYLVGLEHRLNQAQIAQAASGNMVIEDYNLNPVEIILADLKNYKYLRLEPNLNWYVFNLSEGRNRQIRKMASYFQNSVQRLIRVSHGSFRLTPEIFNKGHVTSTIIGSQKDFKVN